MKTKVTGNNLPKSILRIATTTAAILLIPFTVMKFTSDVDWDMTDFIVMGTLIFGTGLAYELITRVVDKKYRIVAGLVLLAGFLYIWAELAVGIFTNLGS